MNAPWYDSLDGITEALERGLEGFTELRNERRAAAYTRKERLQDWHVFGRFWLDTCGNTWTAHEVDRSAPAVSSSATTGDCTLKPIASADDTCSRCGQAWTLRDAHDFMRTSDGEDQYHRGCFTYLVQERTREEFREVVEGAGLDASTLRAIPNRYGSGDWNGPWYLVASPMGDVRLGWRKRVIEIEWTPGPDGRELFGSEPVTSTQTCVHAYGTAEAREYLKRLLKASSA